MIYLYTYIPLSFSQKSLFNVLRAFSANNNQIGYVQGMGFITAILLNYMDEESVFWMLHSIMENEKFNMKGHFMNGMPDLNKSFYKLIVLIKKYLPKIYELFVNITIK